MSTSYTDSNVYKVTRKNYRMKKTIRTRDPITGKEVNIILPKGVYKREYFGFCEVCGSIIPEGKSKSYHHWNPDVPVLGVWVCYKCHKVIEGVDKGIADKYTVAKKEIERLYAIAQLRETGVEVDDDWGK